MNYKPYQHAVAGHPDSILTESSGAVVVKTCIEREKEFYLKTGHVLDLEFVGLWTPKFYGTLKLFEKEDGDVPDEGAPKDSIVLENLTHQFKQPCVMDIKLGVQLWDETATPEKIVRMTERAANTTSAATGVRLTGFEVWDSQNNKSIDTPKTYGVGIKSSELYEGIARFFPTCNSPILPAKLGAPASVKGMSEKLMIELLECIAEDIEQMKAKTSKFEWKAIASSMLIVYEGDEECLASALQKQKQAWNGSISPSESADTSSPQSTAIEATATIDKDDSIASDDAAAAADDVVVVDDDDDDPPGGSISHRVRLIDFAHTTIRPGQGFDEGFNLGMETISRLIKERLEAVRKLQQ